MEIPVAKELADFIFSISPSFKAALMEKGALVEFTQYLNSKKDRRGFIPVTKDAGLFVCKVPKGKG
ncbi:hypothetical protein ACFOSW_15580 [Paenibacillus sp. GCM10012303]